MDERIVKFLKRHRISVLTTVNGDQPHSAALHFACSLDPFYFVFLTDVSSRKMEGIRDNKSHKASLVIGFNEEEWVTMQMEGEVKWVVDKEELNEVWDVYAGKFAGSEKNKEDLNSAILKFTPNWWRYTEVKPAPSVVISSED